MKYIISLFLILQSMTIAAQEQDIYVSATFKIGSESLKNKIEFPDIQGNIELSINCNAIISKFGEIEYTVCMNRDEIDKTFIPNIYAAAIDHKINPAYLNGNKKSVLISYMVQFVSFAGLKIVNIYPNYGYNYKEYGTEYIAPQRYGKLYWGSRSGNYNPCGNEPVNYQVMMDINKTGAPDKPIIINKNLSNKCESYILNSIDEFNFIPGFYKSEPVQLDFVANFYNDKSFFVSGNIRPDDMDWINEQRRIRGDNGEASRYGSVR